MCSRGRSRFSMLEGLPMRVPSTLGTNLRQSTIDDSDEISPSSPRLEHSLELAWLPHAAALGTSGVRHFNLAGDELEVALSSFHISTFVDHLNTKNCLELQDHRQRHRLPTIQKISHQDVGHSQSFAEDVINVGSGLNLQETTIRCRSFC